MLIKHQSWYAGLVKDIFVNKRATHHVLTRKDTVYNSRIAFCKNIRMPLKEGRLFWRLLGKEAKGLFLDPASEGTVIDAETKHSFKERVNTYPIFGPLGSQGPKIPVNVKEMRGILNDETSSMSGDWKKGT